MEPRLVARVGVGASPADAIPTWVLWAGLAGAAYFGYRAVYGSPAPRRSTGATWKPTTRNKDVSSMHYKGASIEVFDEVRVSDGSSKGYWALVRHKDSYKESTAHFASPGPAIAAAKRLINADQASPR